MVGTFFTVSYSKTSYFSWLGSETLSNQNISQIYDRKYYIGTYYSSLYFFALVGTESRDAKMTKRKSCFKRPYLNSWLSISTTEIPLTIIQPPFIPFLVVTEIRDAKMMKKKICFKRPCLNGVTCMHFSSWRENSNFHNFLLDVQIHS